MKDEPKIVSESNNAVNIGKDAEGNIIVSGHGNIINFSASDQSGKKDSPTQKQNDVRPEPEEKKNPEIQEIPHGWVLKVSVGSALAFLIALMSLAVFIPEPKPFQIFVFRVVLSLAAAGFGATMPGFLKVELPLWKKGLISATGAIALFVVVYKVNPPELIHQPSLPHIDIAKKSEDKTQELFKKEDFVFLPSGSFNMGCINGDNDCNDNEKPANNVSIKKGFRIGKHEITQKQWKEVMNHNQSFFQKGDDYPVEMVSWNDIQDFVEKLGKLTGKKYRLPTEAEWEYACRNRGNYDRFSGGNEPDMPGWQESDSNDSTHPVGAKKPNSLGIYDMSGNVWEWCQDVYRPEAYDKNQTVTVSDDKDSERVVRGGSWNNPAVNCRCTFRRGERPNESKNDIGFRLVLEE